MSQERETLEVDVLFVGAGPASLSGALRLRQLIDAHNRSAGPGRRLENVSIAVIEKGREIGAHSLSGAILDPHALRELFPGIDCSAIPMAVPVRTEEVCYLTSHQKLRLPWLPPPLRNHGNYIVSLNRFVKWLAEKAEAQGIDLFPGFAGVGLLFEDDRLIGIRTGDRGLNKEGKPKSTFEPGVDILAKAVVFGEGVHGSLAKQLIQRLGLDAGRNPAAYALGIKEVWEVPHNLALSGQVIHTLGYPLREKEYGGGFLYHSGDSVSLGLVVGLSYGNPFLDPYVEFQRWKSHPLVRSLIAGGKMTHFGAKSLPEGGHYAIPKSSFHGGLLIGDSAGLLNSQRLKGIHLAMKSGMLAAEVLYQAVQKGDFSEVVLSQYESLLAQSWAGRELYAVRNFHQGFEHGLLAGMVQGGLQMLTGGRGWKRRLRSRPGHERLHSLTDRNNPVDRPPAALVIEGSRTADKVSSIYYSGIEHEEDQPSHLLISDLSICHSRCAAEYANPCQRFCPAGVYEMVDPGDGTERRLQINSSNCVHCKTCDIMDPYQIITWVSPEGGSGPNFVNS
jgi:electron-transferring-flavoprotein dehydrogenase